MKAHIATLFLMSLSALSAEKPNVVYIYADDLGYGELSCYGQRKLTTPNIDRLASEGLRFTNHYSGNTVCSPSRACLMMGVHPGHCHIQGNMGEDVAALNTDLTVLPEIFKNAGYATGAFGKWGLGNTTNTDRQSPLVHGFDEFCGPRTQTSAHTYFPSGYVFNGEEIPLKKGTYLQPLIMDKAREFISKHAEAGTPFFCYIPALIPHAAMHSPADLHAEWRKKFPQFENVIGKYGAGPGEDCPDVVNPIAGFAAMMEELDNDVGAILALLDKHGIADNTLVMFSSDNGAHHEGGHDPEFWNSTGGLRGGKRDMHEGGIRVPMLARWPAVIRPGTTTDLISAQWDILPTIAEITGQDTPTDIDGISMMPVFEGKDADQNRHEFLYWEFTKKAGQVFSQAARMGKWKVYKSKDNLELYDLENDPYEKHDLSNSNPEVVSKFEKIIRESSAPSNR